MSVDKSFPLKPEYGPCSICATVGCYPLRHDRLENDAQALSFARKILRDGTSDGRHTLLAGWIVREITKRGREGKRDS